VLDFVTLYTDLVRPDNGLKAVVLAEALGDIRAELQTDATLARSTARLWLRVSPEHLHHQTLLAGLPLVVAVEFPDVVQCDFVVREETTMQDEILLADQSGQRQS